MTREEAIQVLRDWDGCFIGHRSDDVNEALNMAIKALEQEPTTKNNLGVDSISRDDVCRYVAEFVNHEFSTKEEEELIDNIITGIERMTSATPQEPQSEWQHDHEILKAYSDGANEVLDNIRFDLYKLYNDRPSDYNHSQRTELFCEVIKILDKYNAESAHDVAQEIVKNNGVVDL